MIRAALSYSISMRYQSSPPEESTTVTCPKCAFEQEEGAECVRCGIIFAKFKGTEAPAESTKVLRRVSDPEPVRQGVGARLFRILPWFSLLLTVGVLLMILRPSAPIEFDTDPQAAEHIAEKMAQLEMAIATGRSHALSLTEAELNHWVRGSVTTASADQEGSSSLKDVRLNLMSSQVRVYALFLLYGKEVSLRLDGTVETRGGFLRFSPTSGQVGSLPLPSKGLDMVVRALFESPKNQAMFQLPPQIESIRLENRALVIVTGAIGLEN
ncbi:MAG: hypothetical protein OEY86_13585 [Nitrospira sp.]|nr:hypothetical protein [Nitrospira sp.]